MKVELDLNRLVPPEERGAFSLRLILHGRRVCIARKPRCGECVLVDICPSALAPSTRLRSLAPCDIEIRPLGPDDIEARARRPRRRRSRRSTTSSARVVRRPLRTRRLVRRRRRRPARRDAQRAPARAVVRRAVGADGRRRDRRGPAEHRGQGIAPALLARVARRMRDAGLVVSTLHPATTGVYRRPGGRSAATFPLVARSRPGRSSALPPGETERLAPADPRRLAAAARVLRASRPRTPAGSTGPSGGGTTRTATGRDGLPVFVSRRRRRRARRLRALRAEPTATGSVGLRDRGRGARRARADRRGHALAVPRLATRCRSSTVTTVGATGRRSSCSCCPSRTSPGDATTVDAPPRRRAAARSRRAATGRRSRPRCTSSCATGSRRGTTGRWVLARRGRRGELEPAGPARSSSAINALSARVHRLGLGARPRRGRRAAPRSRRAVPRPRRHLRRPTPHHGRRLLTHRLPGPTPVPQFAHLRTAWVRERARTVRRRAGRGGQVRAATARSMARRAVRRLRSAPSRSAVIAESGVSRSGRPPSRPRAGELVELRVQGAELGQIGGVRHAQSLTGRRAARQFVRGETGAAGTIPRCSGDSMPRRARGVAGGGRRTRRRRRDAVREIIAARPGRRRRRRPRATPRGSTGARSTSSRSRRPTAQGRARRDRPRARVPRWSSPADRIRSYHEAQGAAANRAGIDGDGVRVEEMVCARSTGPGSTSRAGGPRTRRPCS